LVTDDRLGLLADSVCSTNALFEPALDRLIALQEADGFDLIESAYRRALEKIVGPTAKQ
jgi:hypothetical protein